MQFAYLQGQPWLQVKVLGQSFMLHQIRKMVHLAVGITRGLAPVSAIAIALQPKRDLSIPMAPDLGLFLDSCIFQVGYIIGFEQGQSLRTLCLATGTLRLLGLQQVEARAGQLQALLHLCATQQPSDWLSVQAYNDKWGVHLDKLLCMDAYAEQAAAFKVSSRPATQARAGRLVRRRCSGCQQCSSGTFPEHPS